MACKGEREKNVRERKRRRGREREREYVCSSISALKALLSANTSMCTVAPYTCVCMCMQIYMYVVNNKTHIYKP